jgi:hypothetical protein
MIAGPIEDKAKNWQHSAVQRRHKGLQGPVLQKEKGRDSTCTISSLR